MMTELHQVQLVMDSRNPLRVLFDATLQGVLKAAYPEGGFLKGVEYTEVRKTNLAEPYFPTFGGVRVSARVKPTGRRFISDSYVFFGNYSLHVQMRKDGKIDLEAIRAKATHLHVMLIAIEEKRTAANAKTIESERLWRELAEECGIGVGYDSVAGTELSMAREKEGEFYKVGFHNLTAEQVKKIVYAYRAISPAK